MHRPNVSGKRFGKWIAGALCGKDKHNNSMYVCTCDCGTVRTVRSASLLSGKSASCGCVWTPAIQIEGGKFGTWTPIEIAGKSVSGSVLWDCQCDCGARREIESYRLRNGSAAMCHCMKAVRKARLEVIYAQHY